MSFELFTFGDQGANITAQNLIARGFRPTIDFGYSYGLLSLLGIRLWFSLFGATPAAYVGASFACQVGVACAIARTASALRFGIAQRVFLALAIERTVMLSYPSFAHGLEAVLLSSAIAEHAWGNRANALALATAGVLAKPSMGYVYAALLTGLILLRPRTSESDTLSSRIEELYPALGVGVALCIVLGEVYGFEVLWRTVLPLSGMANYRAMHMGFFTGEGANFWHPPTANWRYYAGTVIGFWALASAYLIYAAVPAASRMFAELRTKLVSIPARRDEVIVTCAILHVVFVTSFFGHPATWNYYSYMLVVGVAAIPLSYSFSRGVLYVLTAALFASYYGVVKDSVKSWRYFVKGPETANLWAPADQRDEWVKVIDLTSGKNPVMVRWAGALETMFPQFQHPAGTYFVVGLMPPIEIQRELTRINRASVVVTPTSAIIGGLPDAPEFKQALASMKPIWRGKYFEIYTH